MAEKNGQKVTIAEKVALTKTEALIHAESFYHYKLIARASGISDDQLKRYRDDDKDFAEQLEKARTRFLNKHIKRSKPEFLLERLEPEMFKQRTESDLTSGGDKIQPILVKFMDENDTSNRDTTGV